MEKKKSLPLKQRRLEINIDNIMNFGIIAAGEGSRLRTEGVEFPKPLVPLDGEPMIGRLLNIFIRLGAESVAVIVNEEMKEVQEYVEDLVTRFPVPFDLIVKSTPSSMHSFYEISECFSGKGRFILTTVDTIFREEDFARYAGFFSQSPEEVDGVMAVTPYIDDEKPLYVEVDDEMRITGFLDKPTPSSRFISGGIYGLGQKSIEVLRNCIDKGVSRMRNFQRELISSGLDLRAYPIDKIIDVDHASDIAKAEAFIK